MDDVLKIVFTYMAIVSVIGFFTMLIDKTKAKAKMWRTPESVLLGLAFLGGAAGVWLGMELFRHKTKHWYFKIGVPIICILELIVVLYSLS